MIETLTLTRKQKLEKGRIGGDGGGVIYLKNVLTRVGVGDEN